jgi:hypothetical protein
MRIAIAMIAASSAAVFAGSALATLPAPSAEAKARAAETAAKAAWTDKVGTYQLCRAQDRVAEAYRNGARTTTGKDAPPAQATPPCADPGPYVSPVTPEANKPLEAAGAHSPPGNATSPPSTTTPAAETTGPKK